MMCSSHKVGADTLISLPMKLSGARSGTEPYISLYCNGGCCYALLTNRTGISCKIFTINLFYNVCYICMLCSVCLKEVVINVIRQKN